MRFVDMSFVLNTNWFKADEDVPRDPEMILHKPESDMWKSLQQGLSTLQFLVELRIWIDCYDDRCCESLFLVPSLFEIGTGTTPKTTFILPACEEQQFDKVKDGILIIKRGKPDFHGDIADCYPFHWVFKGQWLPMPFPGLMFFHTPRKSLTSRLLRNFR